MSEPQDLTETQDVSESLDTAGVTSAVESPSDVVESKKGKKKNKEQ